MTIRRIGAWTMRGGVQPGWTTLKNRAADVGLTDVCLMINGSDDDRAHLFAAPRIIAEVCDAYRAAGIAPWLATWARPSLTYMDRAADSIAAITRLTTIAGVHVDAEEPWLAGSTGHRAAAERFAERMTALALSWWTTGIVHTNMAEEGQLVRLSSGGIVQAYSTRKAWARWGVLPGTAQTRGYAKWLKFGRPVQMGLACYDQDGAGGMSEAAAMAKAIAATAKTGANTLWYWSLETMTGDAADVIRGACRAARSAARAAPAAQ